MFEIKNMDIYIYPKYLVKNLSITLNRGDKLAIIGEEGSGKSTLLKAILDTCDYAVVSGSINFHGNKVGYLEQSTSDSDLLKKVWDYIFKDDMDYYHKVGNLYKYLERLKLNDSILDQVINTLSGGEKVKIRILKLLLEDVDIFLLDEPTNDLDIETLEWLESFINRTDKPVIYISHDETLLSNTANMILHLEQIKRKAECRHTILRLGYDAYIKERLEKLKHQTQIARLEKREYKKKNEKLQQIMQKVAYQQNTISRSDPHGARLLKKKMHSLKSQQKKLKNSDLVELPDVEEAITFAFEEISVPKAKTILKLDMPILQVQDKILSKNIKLDVIGPQHICIVGDNGIGKTTLIRNIFQKLEDRRDIKLGYMPQVYEDILCDYENVLDFISREKSKDMLTKARMYLGNMKFTEDEMMGKISDLSNGTKAKLILMKFVLDKCDVLLLDEPTRNVSPLSNPVIRNVLKEFKGVIISVSHDRKYIQEVINRVYLLTINGLIEK